MKSLLSQIVSELVIRYPYASSEDITSVLIDTMETEILPNAFKAMKLPPPPSPMRLLLEKKREERRKKKHRTAIMEHKMKLAQNFEYIKHKLGSELVDYAYFGSESNEENLDNFIFNRARLWDSSVTLSFSKRSDGLPLPEGVGFSRFGRRLERERSPPYTIGLVKRIRETQFIIDNQMQDKILSDPMFMDAVSAIEVFLRDFAKSYPEASFRISIETDLEISTWEKIIVTLTLPDLSLDKKMCLWDDIDTGLRMTLRGLVPHPKKSEIEKINRRLFTHVDL